jgi:hypothetical protein
MTWPEFLLIVMRCGTARATFRYNFIEAICFSHWQAARKTVQPAAPRRSL